MSSTKLVFECHHEVDFRSGYENLMKCRCCPTCFSPCYVNYKDILSSLSQSDEIKVKFTDGYRMFISDHRYHRDLIVSDEAYALLKSQIHQSDVVDEMSTLLSKLTDKYIKASTAYKKHKLQKKKHVREQDSTVRHLSDLERATTERDEWEEMRRKGANIPQHPGIYLKHDGTPFAPTPYIGKDRRLHWHWGAN